MSRRTSVIGDLSSRKRRTELRSSSCSSLKAKFMVRSPSKVPGRYGSPGRIGDIVVYQTGAVVDHRVTMLTATDAPPAAPDRPGPNRGGNRRKNVLHYEDSLVEVHRVVVGPMDN